jgi:dihydroorotase
MEVRAVETAIRALEHVATGRLHLQHLSTSGAVDLLRRAREAGLALTAEVTAHHLAMQQSAMLSGDPLRKVNPPMRQPRDVTAVRDALVAGVIDAIATDHAPHRDIDKRPPYERAAAGIIGLETALAQCLSVAELAGAGLPRLVAALTVGPHRVLGDDALVPLPRLRINEPATATLFDPGAEWTVTDATLHSRSRNTPLLGATLRGRVLFTVASGRVLHIDQTRLGSQVAMAHG